MRLAERIFVARSRAVRSSRVHSYLARHRGKVGAIVTPSPGVSPRSCTRVAYSLLKKIRRANRADRRGVVYAFTGETSLEYRGAVFQRAPATAATDHDDTDDAKIISTSFLFIDNKNATDRRGCVASDRLECIIDVRNR